MLKVLVPIVALAFIGGAGPNASAEDRRPRSVVEAVFAAFNRHDPAAMASHYAPDAVLTSSEWCAARRGPDGLRRAHEGLFAAAPDIRDELIDIVTEGDRVAVRFVSRSRIPGREFEMTIGDFFRVENGLIVEDHTIFDNGGRACQQGN